MTQLAPPNTDRPVRLQNTTAAGDNGRALILGTPLPNDSDDAGSVLSLPSPTDTMSDDQRSMEPAREKGRRWVISSKDEMRQAVIEIAKEASRKVSIFSHDLDPGIYDDPDFLDVIKHLVLSQTYARIRVLIADPAKAIKNGNSFVHLGRRLNTYIEFRHVREDLRTHSESYCIADESALVYRLQADRWEGIADTYEPAICQVYGKTFDEIWQASEVELEFRQLGI